MSEKYGDDDLLLLSGIQHMAFCERQWALIYIERIWAENVRTIEGKNLHARADDPFIDESRKTRRIVRSVPVISCRLGLHGVADVVEFHLCQDQDHQGRITCRLKGHKGWWRPVPVEYKRGRPKPDDRDAVQLCAQAMALEEMMGVSIPTGFIYYGEPKRREPIALDARLRQHTMTLAARMHQLVRLGITPRAVKGKHCSQCSLVEECQPYWMLRHRPIAAYLARMCSLEDDKPCGGC